VTKEKKVGLFVVAGLLVMALGVFLIGENRKFWQRKVTYTVIYSDVAGLRAGSPISMGGVDVGTVAKVTYAPDPQDPHVYVTLEIVRDQAARIRKPVYEADGKTIKYKGTVASVVNKGLLGDKMISLSIADGRAPILDPSEPMTAEEPLDIGSYVAKLDHVVQKADTVLQNLSEATKPMADPQFGEDIHQTVSSLRDILDGVAHKDSTAHRLIFDPKEADRVDHILANLDSTTSQLNMVLADTHDVTTHVRTGPGLAHAMIYDGEMSASAAGALSEVHKDLEHIRTGNGLLHALVYGDTDSQHLMGNFNAMSDDLRAIVADIRGGKGTLGALLVDPSIYEDLKSILGNVDRNSVLRSLVRYSIKTEESKQPAPLPKAKDDGAKAP
jgi:phospholipid/cholesterol/gamma-HCH transport system substrate-binding protein